ncbi:MAG: hypothetical protein ACAH88_11465 [Roseimicrobium sp.]
MSKEPHDACRLCSQLRDHESGCQTHGRPEEDTFLPKIGEQLKHVRTIHPDRNSSPELKRCPECGTHYLFQDVYEYFATGSEDTQTLRRLSDEEVAKLP